MAAIFAFVAAVMQIFGALVSFVMAAGEELFGPAGIGYAYAIVDLVLAVLSVWGGIAVLRGKSNKVLIYTALVLAALQIIQTTTVIIFHYGSPVSTIVGIMIALLLIASLMTERSEAFFLARGGNIAQRQRVLVAGVVLAVVAVVVALAIALTAKPDRRTASSEHATMVSQLVIGG